MYARGEGHVRLVVGMYIDDLAITGADAEVIHNFKMEMMASSV